MNRLVGVFLFTLFSYLLWLYLASNHSTPDDWWTVKYIRETHTEDNDIKVIPHHFSTSSIKVLIGSGVFILLGTLLSIFVREKTKN
ncbi:hypothetical protein JOC95_001939 [Bacillus tianshenii]|uniref:Uncharacterized protein n=1 Tax=Sutcliffiella tianshenii TaxID=1463404 RepID=A0ABS2P0B9_9BACI|nr:hypothetical protein [Bacillus tianshenii]MBM7620087.1 hypothetical protein [Bacillus tianshenii]MCA1318358.1 hypothetical protein [Bacillus tianshenii]